MISSDVPESQLPILYLGKYFLPCCLASFVYFAFARVIFMRLRLINERSIGGQFDVSVSQLNDSASSEEYEDAGPRGSRSQKKANTAEFVEIEMASRV